MEPTGWKPVCHDRRGRPSSGRKRIHFVINLDRRHPQTRHLVAHYPLHRVEQARFLDWQASLFIPAFKAHREHREI